MIKSPLNYIGGKYKLLPQILPLFPEHINTFVDMFAGGLDVSINVEAQHVICNDINNYVIGLFEYFQHYTIDELIANIHGVINEYGLTKQTEKATTLFEKSSIGLVPLFIYFCLFAMDSIISLGLTVMESLTIRLV